MQRELTAPVEKWVDAVDSTDILNAPEDFLVGYGAVCRSIAMLLETGDATYAPSLVTALAACEFVMAEHPTWTEKAGLPPIQPLSSDWLALIDDGSAEFRLAASVSALRPIGYTGEEARLRPFRTHLEPVDYRCAPEGDKTSLSWDFKASKEVLWDKETDVDGLNAIYARRIKLWEQSPADFDQSPINARPADITAFLEAKTDEAKLSRLCFELSLVDTWTLADNPWSNESQADESQADESQAEPQFDPAYALAKLCYTGRPLGPELPLNRDIHLLANRGDIDTAIEFAGAHMRKHGYSVGRDDISTDLDSRRVAAALIFPIANPTRETLARSVSLSS